MNILNRLIMRLDKVNNWFLRIGFVSLLGMLIIDFLNVFSLKLGFGLVIPGGKEMIEELMVVTVYCGVAFVALRRDHIKTEVLTQYFSPKLRFSTDIIGHLIIVFVSFFLFWRSTILVQSTVVTWSVKQGLIPIPLFPSRLIMSLAFLLLFISVLLVLIKVAASKGAEVEHPHLEKGS